jgi:hypothetical protein
MPRRDGSVISDGHEAMEFILAPQQTGHPKWRPAARDVRRNGEIGLSGNYERSGIP